MALDYLNRQSVATPLDQIRQPKSCRTVADLVFERGLLKMSQYRLAWEAGSGPYGNGRLPAGRFECTNLRPRTNVAMVRDGVGFSVDLNPLFHTDRTLLRIHPDGNVSGTLGCIGITDADVAGCYKAISGGQEMRYFVGVKCAR